MPATAAATQTPWQGRVRASACAQGRRGAIRERAHLLEAHHAGVVGGLDGVDVAEGGVVPEHLHVALQPPHRPRQQRRRWRGASASAPASHQAQQQLLELLLGQLGVRQSSLERLRLAPHKAVLQPPPPNARAGHDLSGACGD
eukprot:scaffold2268_cov349-Prasinococcus_capsulatus_cf.AAC.11